VKIKEYGFLDRTERTSRPNGDGAVPSSRRRNFRLRGPSLERLDQRTFSDEYEPTTALVVAVFGLVWILAAAAYYRTARERRA